MLYKISTRISIYLIILMSILLGLIFFFLVSDHLNDIKKAIRGKGKLAVGITSTIIEETLKDQNIIDLAPHIKAKLNRNLIRIQSELLRKNQIEYIILMDINRNILFEFRKDKAILDGDINKTILENRAKRLFKREFYNKAGKIFWDLSTPIFVKNMHWGVFRLGFKVEDDKYFSRLNRNFFLLLLSIVIIIILIIYFATYYMTKPFQNLYYGLGMLSKGEFTKRIPSPNSPNSRDEVGDLIKLFNNMANYIEKYISKLKKEIVIKQRIENELQIGYQLQMSFLPKIFPPFPEFKEFDIHAVMKPARQVGGDFYDFFMLDSGKLFIAIGDVSGKGISASLHMAITKTLLRSKCNIDHSAGEILTNLNYELSINNDELFFVTVFLGILDIKTGSFNFSNGGHNPPMLLKNKSSSINMIEDTEGMALGVDENFKYRTKTIELGSGDKIFFYTDGATDAIDIDGKIFNEARLEKAFKYFQDQPLKECVESILKTIREYSKKTYQVDDITLMELIFSGP